MVKILDQKQLGHDRRKEILFKNAEMGLSWWLSGKESTCQCRRHGSIPGLGRSHMPQAMDHNYCACALEPRSHNY